MKACLSETSSETTGEIIKFFGKKREVRPVYGRDETSSQVCLDRRVWSKLPEELLIHIFVRLPVNDIVNRICRLNKSWSSTITSLAFQQAFADASVVRVALMVCDELDGTMFLTQENKEECFRFHIARRPELGEGTSVAATADGLVCVIEAELEESPRLPSSVVGIRVFVMNIVNGVRRELPPPRIMTFEPKLVRMERNVAEGGYTITIIHTKGSYSSALEVFSWQVYDSARNIWREDDVEALAHLNDANVFNMRDDSGIFYENLATFHKETKEIEVFNLHASSATFIEWISDPNGHVHNVSGELYKVCMREETYGVWKLTSSGGWEMVCKFPEVEGVQTCLRLLNEWVVLVFSFDRDRFQCKDNEGRQCPSQGTIVKVFHMPSKSWHTFPIEEYFISKWGYNYPRMRNVAFIVEAKFDATP